MAETAYVANNPVNWIDPTGHSTLAVQQASQVLALMVAAVIAGATLPPWGIAVGIVIVALVLTCALEMVGCAALVREAVDTITGQGASEKDDPNDDDDDDPTNAPKEHPRKPRPPISFDLDDNCEIKRLIDAARMIPDNALVVRGVRTRF